MKDQGQFSWSGRAASHDSEGTPDSQTPRHISSLVMIQSSVLAHSCYLSALMCNGQFLVFFSLMKLSFCLPWTLPRTRDPREVEGGDPSYARRSTLKFQIEKVTKLKLQVENKRVKYLIMNLLIFGRFGSFIPTNFQIIFSVTSKFTKYKLTQPLLVSNI